MPDLVQQTLAELIARYGRDLSSDARRCEALLKDMCPQNKREIFVLVSAVTESVTVELLNSSTALPKEVQLSRLTKRLNDNTGVAEDMARWAVESWALALGIASTQDLCSPFKCPGCDAILTLATHFAGQAINCPTCKASLLISADGRDISLYLAAGKPGQPIGAGSLTDTVSVQASTDTQPAPSSTQATARSAPSRPQLSDANTLVDELSGQGICVDEPPATLFSPLYDRAPLDTQTIQRVRSHLTTWADQIPHHKYRNFGDTLSIREAAHIPYYYIYLQTQYETRTVARVTEPYSGGRIPQFLVNEQNIDIWSYDWPLTTEFESAEKSYRIDDSQEVIDCKTCRASGQLVCKTCCGTGRVQCRQCGGSGQVRQSRSVTKWRQVPHYNGQRVYLVNEPYQATEYYQVQCVTCSATGKATCDTCDGSKLVKCHICRGSGEMVSLLVVTNSFGPEVDPHVHPNQWCNEPVAGLLEEGSDYRPVLSLCGNAIVPPMFAAMENKPLQEKVIGVLDKSQSRCCGTQRVLKQKLWIGSADVIHIGYVFQECRFDLHLAGPGWTVHAPMSPLVRLIENTVAWVQERLETGDIGRGLKMLKRCFDMHQADHVAEPVFRMFCKRFADAYASEAESLGKWSAESRYFSDRARQLEPTNSAASAHEFAVGRILNVVTFAPACIAGAISGTVGVTSNRPDVFVFGVATPLLLSILFWAIYVRKAISTVIVFGISLFSSAISAMAFQVLASQSNATPENGWQATGAMGVALILAMAATSFLPKSLRREKWQGTKGVREALARVQTFYEQDWEDVKEAYKTGPFLNATAR